MHLWGHVQLSTWLLALIGFTADFETLPASCYALEVTGLLEKVDLVYPFGVISVDLKRYILCVLFNFRAPRIVFVLNWCNFVVLFIEESR